MQPTPSKFKKFLVPGVIIIGLVLVGVLLFMKGGTIDQGAALFNATTKTASIKTGVTGTLNPNTQPLPCFAGSTTPKIKVMSPNGGETFTAGQQITVKWSTCNVQNFPGTNTSAVSILLKQQSTGVRYTLIPNTNPQYGYGNFTQNDGSEVVILPTSLTYPVTPISYGTDFKVIVVLAAPYPPIENNTGAIYDESDNLFTINGSGVACLENNPRRFGLLEDELSLATTTHPNLGNPNIANLGDFKINPAETASICALKGINLLASANPMAPLSSVRIVDVATNQVIGSTTSFQAPVQGGSWTATIPVTSAYSLDPGKRFRLEGVMRQQPLQGTTNMLTLGITGFKAGTNSINISTVMDLYSRVLSLQ